MAHMILVSFLPFEVRLTIEAESLRKLAAEPTLGDNISSLGSNSNTNMNKSLPSFSMSHQRRRDTIQVDIDKLTDILEEYFDDHLSNSFSDLANNNEKLWAPFSHVSLSDMRRRRRRLLEDADGIEIDEDMENESLLDMEGVFNNESPLDMDMHMAQPKEQIITLNRVKSGNLRRRNEKTTYLVAEQYSGVAIFNKDGDLPIPSNNELQEHQLGAQADSKGRLLLALRDKNNRVSPSGDVTAVSLSVALGYQSTDPAVSNNSNVNMQNNGTPITGTNAVIVIAVAVAACSMCLLGFALYLAFRRRQQPEMSHNNTQLKELSPNNNRTLPATNDISPLTTATQRKGHPDEKIAPPVLEMQVHPHHDDAISEYTESVYSLPVTAGASMRSNSVSARGDLTQRQRQLLRNQDELEKPKVSNRFNPRYIISSKRSSNASDSDNEQSMAEFCGVGRGALQEMEGVPQLTTPMKEALRQTQVSQSHDSSDVTPLTGISADIRDRASTARKPNSAHATRNSKRSSKAMSPSGLYPADVIDDDINSSLAGYTKGANVGKSFRNYMGDDSVITNNKNDDGGSVSSYESYGFSLDGADYSTVANSTRYGY